MNNKSDNLIIRLFISKVLHAWYWFLISFVFFMGIAVFYYKFTPPVYESSLALKISSSSRGYRQSMQPGDFLQGFQLLQQTKEIENEMVVLQSLPLIRKTLNDLDFKVAYYYKENYLPYRYWPFYKHPELFLREMYEYKPFEIILDEKHPQPVGTYFYINILNDKEFTISLHAKDVPIYDYHNDITLRNSNINLNIRAKFGDTIKGPDYSFRVLLNSQYSRDFENKDLYFSFQDMYWLARGYQNSLSVKRSSFESSIVMLYLKGLNIQKSLDFLNKLADNYIQREIEKKEYIANMTIEYIDNELSNISSSLNISEGQLQNFKSKNQVMNIEQKTTQLSQYIQNLENQKNEILQNLRFYKELYKYFEENKNSSSMLAPSSMGVEDPVLNNMIQQLATYNAEKNTLEEKNLQRNPRYKTLTKQINDLKSSILENIQFYITSTQSRLDEINSNINRYKYQESILPRTQTKLLGYERNFKLNNDLYNFLLQKRAEAQIAKASIVPDSTIIEPATFLGSSSSKKMLILLFALFMAFIIPAGFIFLKIYFNNKITNVTEVETLSNLPLIGKILHSPKKSDKILFKDPLSPVSESFRKLRTNLDFFIKDETNKVFLITSAGASEGKSFVAINLAVSLSMLNKKTLLLGFDLRKPSELYQNLGINKNAAGLTSFLTKKKDFPKIINHTQIPDLDVIPAGLQHPNPSELFVSDDLVSLIKRMREEYDFVIIDTAPLGLVSDAFLLMKYSDVNLFIVRQGITNRSSFQESLKEMKSNKVNNVCIVVNDLKPGDNGYGYKGYKAYYKYKPKKKNRFTRIFKGNKSDNPGTKT